MTKYTVGLDDETVGTIYSDTLAGQSTEDFMGEIVNVHLCDEKCCIKTHSGTPAVMIFFWKLMIMRWGSSIRLRNE